MKTVKLGDYLFWDGELAQVTYESRERSVGIEYLKNKLCPHCGEIIGKEVFDVIPTSPLFQEKAEPIQTIKDES